jgi:hypothetical protein
MYNCSKDVLGFHNDKVTLPEKERGEMRDRRNSNRDRIKNGLKNNDKPSPLDFCSQGSYAMRTMTQHPEKDYDIDDGCNFEKGDLKNENGTEMTALEAKQMVRDAVDNGSFKTPPAVCENCVRVYYDAGYHVDIPVYREVTKKNIWGNEEVYNELAASDWTRSDARNVTAWFDNENQSQSPDETNGRQLRRIVRSIKKFAISRPEWKGKIGSGFLITKLVTEKYQSNLYREDESLYYTMRAIRDRLEYDLVVNHPVTPNCTITKGNNDSKARFLKDKLSEAIDSLQVLFESDCTAEKAAKAWDKVFNTDYFINKYNERKNAEKAEQIRRIASSYSAPAKPWGN